MRHATNPENGYQPFGHWKVNSNDTWCHSFAGGDDGHQSLRGKKTSDRAHDRERIDIANLAETSEISLTSCQLKPADDQLQFVPRQCPTMSH